MGWCGSKTVKQLSGQKPLLIYRPTLQATPERFMDYCHARQSGLAKMLFLALPNFLQGSMPQNSPRGKVIWTHHCLLSRNPFLLENLI